MTVLRAVLRRQQDQDRYNQPEVVNEFLELEGLFPPEQAILSRLQEWLPGKTVLDVGVGAGRTAAALATKAERYLGVDYAPAMIDACHSRFGDDTPQRRFLCLDATRIRSVGGTWDLVQFSYNGLDHLDITARRQFFSDVTTLLEPDGYFTFSSHNMCHLPAVFRYHPHGDPGWSGRVYAVYSWMLVRLANPPLRRLMRKPFALVADGSLAFGVRVYYGTADDAVSQLEAVGFSSVVAFGTDGRVLDVREPGDDAWITYLCRLKK